MSVFSLKQHLADVAAANGRGFVDGWQPKNDCAFVLPLVEASQSKGGIIAPEQARERPQKGIVIAIGAGLWDPEQRQLYPVEVAVGDLVTYGKYSGELFEVGGVGVFIMKNVEIKARISAGAYPELTEHHLGEGSAYERFTYHEAHLRCEHCPDEKTSALVEEERARLVSEQNKDLNP